MISVMEQTLPQSENLSCKESKVMTNSERLTQTIFSQLVCQLVDVALVGVEMPQLGSHCQHLLHSPGSSWGARYILLPTAQALLVRMNYRIIQEIT